MISPGELAKRLTSLSVNVERVFCEVVEVDLEAYPGAKRPMAVVHLAGSGEVGRGENVSWTLGVQDRFAAHAKDLLRGKRGRVGTLISPEAEPYAKAALEAALIDLGLRQARKSIAEVAEVGDGGVRPVRYVVSFDATPNPAQRLERIRAANRGARFKVDVEPSWTEGAIAELAATEAVDMLDFKERGDDSLVEQIAAAFPEAVLEDPPLDVELEHEAVARDIPIRSAADAKRWAGRGITISIKAPRMGGVLEALRGLEAAHAVGVRAHVGGMWEMGPGREQARILAALYTGDEPNDVAPIPRYEEGERDPSPLAVRLDLPGFGSHGSGGATTST